MGTPAPKGSGRASPTNSEVNTLVEHTLNVQEESSTEKTIASLRKLAVDRNTDGTSLLQSAAGPLKDAQQLSEKFSWQQISDVVTVLQNLALSPDQIHSVLQQFEKDIIKRLRSGNVPASASTVTKLLSCFSSLQKDISPEFLSALTGCLHGDLGSLQTQDLVDVANALSSLTHYPGSDFLADLCHAVQEQSSQLDLQQLTALLQALAHLHYYPGAKFVDQICSEARERQAAPPAADEICTFVWAVAMVGGIQNIPHVISPIIDRMRFERPSWRVKDLGKLLWALATGGLLSEELVTTLNMKSIIDAEEATLETNLHLAAGYLALPALAQHLPQSLLLQAVQAWKRELADTFGATKQVGAEVAATVGELGFNKAEGVPLEDGLLCIDVALPSSQIAICIELEESFSKDPHKQPLGSTILLWRLLSLRGWKVVCVPVHEWSAVNSMGQTAVYIHQLLQNPCALESLQQSMSLQGAASDMASVSEMASRAQSVGTVREPRSGSSVTAGSGSLAGSSLLGSTATNSSDQTMLGLSGLSSRLSNLPDVGMSGSSEQDNMLAGSLYGLNMTASGADPSKSQLPALTKPFAPNTAAYWDQVALASRLAAMRIMPQVPMGVPANQGLPEGPLADIQAGLAGPSTASLVRDFSQGFPGQLPAQDFQGLNRPVNLPQMASLGSGSFMPNAGFPPGSTRNPSFPGPPLGGELGTQSQGDLRQLWQMVTKQVEPGRGFEASHVSGVSVSELKRVIELLPLETSAVNAVAPHLALLDPPQFANLLTELARDNHAFRAWQLFDWVRTLPEENDLRRLCDSNTYTTMISLCGPWQQVRRALSLVADMRARSLECGIQAYSALLNAAVKCGEVELAVDVYHQMGQEGMDREKPIFQTMVDVFVKMGRHADALSVLEDMKKSGQSAEVQLYNLIVLSCTKLNNPRAALDVYKRMAEDGVQPNTKTFTALIGSVGRMSTVDQAMDIIDELLSHEKDSSNLTQTYSALMSACEKAGQWDLAVALFDKMSAQGCKPDVGIFNSMIAACAHGGEFNKARLMFERMAEHNCVPDAVTYANLIRAYKKGGQWCHALDTFEAMQRNGCRPHAAVFSSIIDVLWQTGSAWAQAKALRLFTSAVENGSLAGAAESCKKGTLKVDLQALTVGVAVLSMAQWLKSARQALLQDQAGPLDSSRKLAVVNGLGEHSRAQGHSAAVKEAVGAGLLGCKAPFRLVQDHSRSGRLEASSLALRKWLFSDAFDAYLNLLQGGGDRPGQLMSTPEYLEKEVVEAAKCYDLFQRIQKYEQLHPVSLKVLHSQPGPYLAMRKQLVSLTLHYAAALQLSQETAHTALALMDRCIMSGIQLVDHLHALLVCACLRVAAVQESAFLPSPLAIQALTNIPAMALERMEATIAATLNNDTECISAVHCLKIYLQRLVVNLSDGEAVRCAAGCAFALATQALAELPMLQFPPSLTAAAVLVAARKAQGSGPFWPSVLSQLTGYTEASTPAFASAIGHAERLCTKLCSAPEGTFMTTGDL